MERDSKTPSWTFNERTEARQGSSRRTWRIIIVPIAVFALLCQYFLAQFDKFILSYFQTSLSQDLSLTSSEYGLLSGYATGIVYAVASLPIAWLSDRFPKARVWTLTLAALWWSASVICQSYARTFAELLLARISMGLGQSCVAPLSISIISDLIPLWRYAFIGQGVFYVGVYIGEAISGQIATAFTGSEDGWRIALRAIGITGMVVAVCILVLVRDPGRKASIIPLKPSDDGIDAQQYRTNSLRMAILLIKRTVTYLLKLRSWMPLVIAASFRQLAGNIFGFYMPTYLTNLYPEEPLLLSRYGIIVGTVGSVAVISGAVLTSIFWKSTPCLPLYLTGYGGIISSLFVLLMIMSRDIATNEGSPDNGVKILYGTMSLAYASAELWLGALDGLVAALMLPELKTFGLAIWNMVQVLVYSSGPEIVGLALRNSIAGTKSYENALRVILAVMIPVCYWLSGFIFIYASRQLRCDLADGVDEEDEVPPRQKGVAIALTALIVCLVISLFIASIYFAAIGS